MTYRTLFDRIYGLFSTWRWFRSALASVGSAPPFVRHIPKHFYKAPVSDSNQSFTPRRIAGIRGAGMDRKVNKRKSDLARLRAIR